MVSKMKTLSLSLFMLLLTTGCVSTRTSSVVSINYDDASNTTTLASVPIGNVDIPGQWINTVYSSTSRQYFFENSDSVTIAIAKNPMAKYPFYTSEIEEKTFAQKFYEWEKAHYEPKGFEITELDKSAGGDYVIWQATGAKVNTVFLYGARHGLAYNLAVIEGSWPLNERINFLKNLFLDN